MGLGITKVNTAPFPGCNAPARRVAARVLTMIGLLTNDFVPHRTAIWG